MAKSTKKVTHIEDLSREPRFVVTKSPINGVLTLSRIGFIDAGLQFSENERGEISDLVLGLSDDPEDGSDPEPPEAA